MTIHNQKGFTLIELMIAITLGLLITAAVTAIYVTGVRNAAVQKAASGILDANVFGLQQIEKNLRMAGLGLGRTSSLNKDCGGIIISSGANRRNCDNQPVVTSPADKMNADIYTIKLEGLRSGMTPLAVGLRTRADGGPTNTSNTNSSQLTIQYRAPVDMRDCEGRVALGPREVVGYADGMGTDNPNDKSRVDGQVVIERYFIKRNSDGQLELRCDSGRYVLEHIFREIADVKVNGKPDTKKTADRTKLINEAGILETPGTTSSLKGMGDDGSLIIAGIDDFQVQLGVSNGTGIQYQNIANYTGNENIVAIKLGILAKGNDKIPSVDAAATGTYTLLGKNITMGSGQPTNVIRRVYETTTMLRNSREK